MKQSLKAIALLTLVAGPLAVHAQDNDRLQMNIAIIRDCLSERHGDDRENCIAVSKYTCRLDVPSCNDQEAEAWDAIAIEKRPALRKTYKARKHRIAKSCAYKNRSEGYAGVIPPQAWEEEIEPSGCRLQHSANRTLKILGKR